jgi:site-specific DNA-methyltransferase (adenine-specific)
VRRWTIHHADCLAVMRRMGDRSVDHVIGDPPYSARTHKGVRSHARKSLRGGNGKRTARVVDLGFPPATRADIERWLPEMGRVARRWVLVFTDFELAPTWRRVARRCGLRFIQVCVWDRVGGAPQFDGLGPAVAAEYILAFHVAHGPEKRRWNGGGKRGLYSHPIVANRLGQRGSRVFSAQKPDKLLIELVDDFTDLGEVVFDPFVGSGTTGVACIRRGRRFIGSENDEETAALARERLRAEERGCSLQALRGGQEALFAPEDLTTERTRRKRGKASP